MGNEHAKLILYCAILLFLIYFWIPCQTQAVSSLTTLTHVNPSELTCFIWWRPSIYVFALPCSLILPHPFENVMKHQKSYDAAKWEKLPESLDNSINGWIDCCKGRESRKF